MNKWADLWEAKVKAGMSESDATAFVEHARSQEEDTLAKPRTATPAESTHAVQVKPEPGYGTDLLKGTVRELAQGATFGAADEGEAALSEVVRHMAAPNADWKYGETRDDIRRQNAAFREKHPLATPLLQTAGSIAAAKAVPGLNRIGAGASPNAMLGRAANASVQGGVAGGAAGALSAEGGILDRLKGGVGGAIGGALMGPAFSMAGDAIGKGRELVRGARAALAQSHGQVPVALPAGAGPKGLLATMARSGKSIDDLERWHGTADAEDIIAEVDPNLVSRLGTADRYGLRPQPIRAGLEERAKNEVGRVKATVREQLGDPVDDVQLKADKLAEARAASGPLYEQATAGNIGDPRVLDLLEKPSIARAYEQTRSAARDAGAKLPSARELRERAQLEPGDVAPQAEQPAKGGRRPNKTTVPTDEELGSMSMDELRKQRSAAPPERLTDRQLAHELHYLETMESADAQKAAFRDMPAYAEYRETGAGASGAGSMREDARGVIEASGHDPSEWHKRDFEAGAAARRMQQRAPRLAALKAEKEGRPDFAEKAGPDKEATRTVEGPGDFTLPEKGGELPTLPAKAVQRWKLQLDDKIKMLEGKVGGSKTSRHRELVRMRNEVEDLLYEHAPGWGEAQAAYAKPMQEATAFAEGQKAGKNMDVEDVKRLSASKHPEYLAKGVTNAIHEDLQALRDGGAGTVNNPANAVMGDEWSRARLKLAAQGDPEKIAAIEKRATGAQNRLQTRHDVYGGSPTAKRVAADENALAAVGENLGAGKLRNAKMSALKGVYDFAKRGTTGAQLDAEAALLMAGAPGHMTRPEAIAILKKMAPYLATKGNRQSAISALAASQIVRQLQP